MRAAGALCTPDRKQQIDSSFVIWFRRKQVFWWKGSTFSIQMNRSISSLSWGLLTSELGGGGGGGVGEGRGGGGRVWKMHSVSFFLTHFFSRVLSPLFAHLFSSTCSL